MRSLRPLLIFSLAIGGLLGAAGCTGTDADQGEIATCYGFSADGRETSAFSPCRVFAGQLQHPPAEQLKLTVKPLQVVGLGFVISDAPLEADGGPGATDGAAGLQPPTDQVSPRFFYSDPFASSQGAGQRPTVPFAITVPCDLAVNLLLQVVTAGGDRAPGLQVAQLQFPRLDSNGELTTLIPGQPADYCGPKTNRYDLGIVELDLAEEGRLSTGVILLGSGNSKNPLALVPAPDGEISDQDQNGDGIIDSAQTFEALTDIRTPGAVPPEDDPDAPLPDGIPDLFQ